MSATPDTGCTRTIINTHVLERNGISYKQGGKIKLVAANGNKMEVDGTIEISIEGNNIKIRTDALVSKAIQDNMLISCSDLIKLRAIPSKFPNAIVEECRAANEDYTKILMEEFKDVLSDELSPTPMKTETPMHISLKKGVVPKKVT